MVIWAMSDLDPQEQFTVLKLKLAYMEDEGLPEYLAEARALADVNRLAGRTDHAFDAHAEVRENKGILKNSPIETSSANDKPTTEEPSP